MDYCVFIQTNHKQIVGALVAEYALRRNSRNNDKFDVRIINTKDYPFFQAREGQLYLRDGVKRPWLNDDLQSFTPTRFMPPELMGYQGRAVVIDPDIFAIGDVWDLLSRDMQGKAILCRPRRAPRASSTAAWPAASCCSTAPSSRTGRSRSSSTRCSSSSATTSPGSACVWTSATPSACSRTSGTTSTGSPHKHQDAARHAPQDPALEGRPADRLASGRTLPAVSAGRLADARAPPPVRRIRAARQLQGTPRPRTRRFCSSAC